MVIIILLSQPTDFHKLAKAYDASASPPILRVLDAHKSI